MRSLIWMSLALGLTLAALGCKKAEAPAVVAEAPVEAVQVAEKPVEVPVVAPAPVTPPVAVSPTVAAGSANDVRIELEEKRDEGFGYVVKMPRGAKELAKDDMAQTYSLVLPDGVNELNINLTHNGATSLEDAVSTATLMGTKEVLENKAIEGGWLVVKGAQMNIQEVWMFQRGKAKPVTAKCTGPSGQLEALKAMCSSLQALK